MPKVLRIINRFNLGGPTFNAAYLTKYLSDQYETLLVGGQWDETEESSQHILNNLGLEPLIVEEMRREISIGKDRSAYKRIKSIIRDFKPDIIHTHASKAGAIGRIAGISYGKAKMVHTFHGHVFHSYFNSLKSNFYKNIERALAVKTDKIIAISPRQKLELAVKYRICPENKIAVIPLGFDLDKFQDNPSEKRASFRKRFNVDQDEVAIGIIGRLVPIKNHRLFLDAMKIVQERSNEKVRAFIVGDGEERENLKAYAGTLGLDYINGNASESEKATVHFTSWIKDIDWVNAGLDIVALTSYNEGTPVSLIEAQASNKPIVTTKVGGVGNTVKPNETALLCHTHEPEMFAEKLLTLIRDSRLRDQMGKEGWAYVNKKFHYRRLANDMSELYASLLNGSH